jgi:transcriptional antiterminator NusG
MTLHWYVIRVQAGKEERVKESILKRIQTHGLNDKVTQALVPTERVTEVRAGKKRTVARKIFPGYLMVEADIDGDEDPRAEEVWFCIRDTPGFGDFVGSHGKPDPMSDQEVEQILGKMEQSKRAPSVEIGFQRGDQVRIKEGAFLGYEGSIEEIDAEKGKVRVLINVLGRSTSVELDHWEVETLA